jgi:hypothetical protein
MSTTSPITTQPSLAPMVYRISVDEYERMVEAGVLDDPRVELIGGLLVRKMGKNPPHVIATKRLGRHLEQWSSRESSVGGLPFPISCRERRFETPRPAPFPILA